MSRMRSGIKPPLPSRSSLQSKSSVQTPPGSLMKSKTLIPSASGVKGLESIGPDFRSLWSELQTLANMTPSDVNIGDQSFALNNSPLFKRGKFYQEYSARRNERLQNKMNVNKDDDCLREYKTPHKGNLGVTMGSMKKGRESTAKKAMSTLRKSADVAILRSSMVEATPATSRYMLRSMSKDMKKAAPLPPIPLPRTRRSTRI